jgi:hypothetical protein
MRRALTAAVVVAVLAGMLPLSAQGARRAVAITIDDLPRGGDGTSPAFDAVFAMNERLLRPFKDGRLSAHRFRQRPTRN